jgi:hypothetical protein
MTTMTTSQYRDLLSDAHTRACELSHDVHLAMDALDSHSAEWHELHAITRTVSLAADIAYRAGTLGGISRPSGLTAASDVEVVPA